MKSLLGKEYSLMMAVEENDFQSNKTDASLYNGRPTDTGVQCHSVGAASRTSSISKYKDGVSVENVRTPIKQWFVLRVSYGRVLKAKEIIDTCHIDCFAPMRHKQITKYGKKHIISKVRQSLNLLKYSKGMQELSVRDSES